MPRYYLLIAAAVSVLFVSACDVTRTPETPTRQPAATVNNATIPSQFKKVSFAELPGWKADDMRYALRAFRNTCKAKVQYNGRVIPDRFMLEEKCQFLPSESADNATVRAWFESHFQPYQIVTDTGATKGLFTGYYSPTIDACRRKTAKCDEPLMGLPTDGRNIKGVPRKQIVDNMIGQPLYWANLVDVQNIQIQGSGTLRLECGTLVKLNFAAVNDMPFGSIGEQLKQRGIRPAGGYSADAVWDHLKQNPALAREVINNNQRYVFFKEAQSHDVIGAMGVPLTKIRSIAIDNTIYTLGLPVFIDTNLSDGRKFQRLMIAQDTGGAIRGLIRGDIYFGTGDEAFHYARGQHAQGAAFILIPKKYEYVKPSF
ncbi:MAG: MltA domain-containing protein [Alphaproteobacteria bacterium]|nr:MltA domain-containing protein [Alphaproteobacteria bacterium]MCL2890087.1 MltA domain-containing protein [Alphaproteobacteria bacterium]